MAPLPASSPSSPPRRALTWRSLAFGLLGILLMSALPGFHDNVCRSGTTMIGNHLPGGAFAYLFFVGFLWNGLAGRIHRSLALAPREMAVVLAATLVACFPPTAGLFRYFFRIVLLPWYYLPGHPEWAQHNLLGSIQPALFPAPYIGHGIPPPGSPEYLDYQVVYQGFFSGLAQGTHWLPLSKLPLLAWLRPMLYWGPLLLLVSLACIAMHFVVHTQWAKHEQLSFPIAQVTGAFCFRRDGLPGPPDIFRKRLFWAGFIPVFLLYLLEFLAAKYPTHFPATPEFLPNLRSWWLPILNTFPELNHAPSRWSITSQSLFFTIVGAAYFVSSEISLAVGLSSLTLVLFGTLYYSLFGSPISGLHVELSRAGAYIGYTLILLYTGRFYFRAIFSKAFSLRRPDAPTPIPTEEAAAILAARILVLAFLGILAVLHFMGFELALALLFATLTLLLFFIFTRIVCETGIPYLQAGWFPPKLLVYLFGPASINPASLTLLYWVDVVLLQDPRECLMPYVATATKVADDTGLNLKRVFWIITAAVVLAIAIAFLASFYTHYNASAMTDGWSSNGAVVQPFNECARLIREMKDVNEYTLALDASPLQRLSLIQLHPANLRFFLLGAALVITCSLLRFKYARFPIHPVLFMVWGTTPIERCWGSFLVGWFLKFLVVRFGGGGVYQKWKPLFIGLIAGELIFVGLQIAYGLLYFFLFGNAPSFGVRALPT